MVLKMSQQFDVDSETQKLYEEKAKRRAVLREQFLKLKTDPFQHASGEGGAVFDAAMQRYTAMGVSTFEHFRPTGKNALYGFLFMIVPMFGFGYILQKSRSDQEGRFRRGEVAYKDRNFKFI